MGSVDSGCFDNHFKDSGCLIIHSFRHSYLVHLWLLYNLLSVWERVINRIEKENSTAAGKETTMKNIKLGEIRTATNGMSLWLTKERGTYTIMGFRPAWKGWAHLFKGSLAECRAYAREQMN